MKIRTAINQPENTLLDYETPWYESRYSSPIASDEWILDPEIPENYVPVPGEEEMYMVVNDSGEIINYRQRTKQIDGSWSWEDITNPALAMNSSSESYKLACIKAADMAIYGYCATESPMYGTLDDLIGRYGCSSANPSENVWKAGDKTASEIHSRLQSNDNSRLIRMSDYTEVGIAVIDVNGNTYYAEVYLK